MRGGFLIGLDAGLYERAMRSLEALGAEVAAHDLGGAVQLTSEDGVLFTLFERIPVGAESEIRKGPFRSAAGVQLPDMSRVTACPFECRSPELVSSLARAIAVATGAPTWVLDSDSVVWDAKLVDPKLILL